MKWPKDRKKAFLWAAEAFGTPWAERTEEQKVLTSCGFCFAIEELTGLDTYSWASTVGDKFGIELKSLHWWPPKNTQGWRTIHDEQRSLFCCFMAALSYKEFEELGK